MLDGNKVNYCGFKDSFNFILWFFENLFFLNFPEIPEVMGTLDFGCVLSSLGCVEFIVWYYEVYKIVFILFFITKLLL